MSLRISESAGGPASSSATQSLSASRKRLTLVATILGSSIAILDSSVVSVALPSIQRSLGGGLAGQQWVSNAYLLTLGSLILLGGSLGDIFGERRVFAVGVGGFGAASLLCALAPSIGLLIAFRALQGIAGALLTPSSLAVIVATLPGAGARPSDRHLDGMGNDRRGARPARRRADPQRRLLAVDLRDQPAAGRRVPLADPTGGSCH